MADAGDHAPDDLDDLPPVPWAPGMKAGAVRGDLIRVTPMGVIDPDADENDSAFVLK